MQSLYFDLQVHEITIIQIAGNERLFKLIGKVLLALNTSTNAGRIVDKCVYKCVHDESL